ncbi:MAG TPA: family 2B encapsulin nanocompartment shell protein [Actinocrinis sp.]|jgi:CRP-like cAMP-binding protein|uniref:family 2B encapsulin nanocompartment shell protein n=1 Tax=Actinocrinis sp. TaxID=1920516 RepID=UPI002DDD3379|nr:family 2B encapsulin nanocompartment shell protein [Actinocrinis sp.]HEV3173360.1 family 2B encapsulin nanocompartment shell protein [Actinocrinis sp.]
MTATIPEPSGLGPASEQTRQSLSIAAARNLATTTKSAPQMQGISSRWLLRKLPWVQVSGGTYRVNRRLSYAIGSGRVSFLRTGTDLRVFAPSLVELPGLRSVDDAALLEALASRFTPREVAADEVIVEEGRPVDEVYLVGHGKVNKVGTGKYGQTTVLGYAADGDHIGEEALGRSDARWDYTVKAATAGTLLVLPWRAFQELFDSSEALRESVMRYLTDTQQANRHGEHTVELASGHDGEVELPGTYVDYEVEPREYELSVAQTVLRIHSRVADLYNDPMDQTEHQLRLTIEELRERQEWELVNNPDFGLLHNADNDQRIQTHSGPPTPDDLDELLSMRRGTRLLLAHPKAIAAFGRECNSRGLYFGSADEEGHRIPAWRGVPIFPCGKIPVGDGHTTSILALRTGEDDQGVVGLHQTGIPDEYEPGLNVRFMGINEKAVISYLVSTYFSAAVLVPDALGVLENVEISRPRS